MTLSPERSSPTSVAPSVLRTMVAALVLSVVCPSSKRAIFGHDSLILVQDLCRSALRVERMLCCFYSSLIDRDSCIFVWWRCISGGCIKLHGCSLLKKEPVQVNGIRKKQLLYGPCIPKYILRACTSRVPVLHLI